MTVSFLATVRRYIHVEIAGYGGRESEPEGQLYNLRVGSSSEKFFVDVPIANVELSRNALLLISKPRIRER